MGDRLGIHGVVDILHQYLGAINARFYIFFLWETFCRPLAGFLDVQTSSKLVLAAKKTHFPVGPWIEYRARQPTKMFCEA